MARIQKSKISEDRRRCGGLIIISLGHKKLQNAKQPRSRDRCDYALRGRRKSPGPRRVPCSSTATPDFLPESSLLYLIFIPQCQPLLMEPPLRLNFPIALEQLESLPTSSRSHSTMPPVFNPQSIISRPQFRQNSVSHQVVLGPLRVFTLHSV